MTAKRSTLPSKPLRCSVDHSGHRDVIVVCPKLRNALNLTSRLYVGLKAGSLGDAPGIRLDSRSAHIGFFDYCPFCGGDLKTVVRSEGAEDDHATRDAV